MKCSCGHLNPLGVTICECCGKLQGDFDRETILKEMRYEGKIRRSQTRSTKFLSQVWKYFSSVKVAIYLILFTLITSAIGTLLPQEKFIPSFSPEVYYFEHYGIWGKLYYNLGLSKMYDSWWFILLLILIGISLVVCSLDRVIPLYKALNKQTISKDISFLEKQRIFFQRKASKEILYVLLEGLKKNSYHIREKGHDILAEKGRISRWGPYVNHVGLIVFLLGLLCSYIPGWYLDEAVWVREGDTKKIPSTPYYIKNDKAFVEYHPNSTVVKKYQTNATLYKKNNQNKLIPLTKQTIEVNKPLKYGDLNLFQSDLRENELKAITLGVNRNSALLGEVVIDLDNVELYKNIPIGKEITARILEYYPDFHFDNKNKRPVSLSNEPNRPAFIFEIDKNGEKERSWVISGEKFETINPNNIYVIKLANLHFTNQSGLMVRIDKRLSILLLGGIITMVGLILGFYWQHRRVWIRWEEGKIYIGAYTNKNWFAMQTEVNKIIPPDWEKIELKE